MVQRLAVILHTLENSQHILEQMRIGRTVLSIVRINREAIATPHLTAIPHQRNQRMSGRKVRYLRDNGGLALHLNHHSKEHLHDPYSSVSATSRIIGRPP